MVSALELLTEDEYHIPSYISKIWGPAIGGALGFGAACFANWGMRRPVFSSVQIHTVSTVIGAGIGQYLDDRRNIYYAEKDAVLRRYVELHPEDFAESERKKFSDVLHPWIPVR